MDNRRHTASRCRRKYSTDCLAGFGPISSADHCDLWIDNSWEGRSTSAEGRHARRAEHRHSKQI